MVRGAEESRLWAFVSAVLTAAGMPFLAVAWTSALPPAAPSARPSHARIAYVEWARGSTDLALSPIAIPVPTAAGIAAAEERPATVSVGSQRRLPNVTVPYSAVSSPTLAQAISGGLDERIALTLTRSRPVGTDGPAYGPMPLPVRTNIVVQIAPALEACGFECAPLLFEGADLAAAHETVSARVETDARGRVTAVWLETRSESPEVNQRVVRALRQSRATRPVGPCAGVVSVTFNGQRKTPSPP
jgi:hypothetical protein